MNANIVLNGLTNVATYQVAIGREDGQIATPYVYNYDALGNYGASEVNLTSPSKWMGAFASVEFVHMHD